MNGSTLANGGSDADSITMGQAKALLKERSY